MQTRSTILLSPTHLDTAETFFAQSGHFFSLKTSGEAIVSLRQDRRRYVEARLAVGNQTWERVAIRIKGSAGSVKPVDDRPALTINVDKYVAGQYAFGMKRLYLNNSAQDLSRMQECFAYEIYTKLGIPAARVTHAVVTLNGRDLGIYVVKEGYDKTFLARHFQQTSGNLYDAPLLMDINDSLELDSGRTPPDDTDIRQLRTAVVETDPLMRLAKLEGCLDVGRFITMIAVQVLTADWDSYAYKPNNYRIYFPPDTRRAVFIPCGTDQLFQQLDWPLETPFKGQVAQALFAIPSARKRLQKELLRVHRTVFAEEFLRQTFDSHAERLRLLLKERPTEEAKQIGSYIGMLRERIRNRATNTAQRVMNS